MNASAHSVCKNNKLRELVFIRQRICCFLYFNLSRLKYKICLYIVKQNASSILIYVRMYILIFILYFCMSDVQSLGTLIECVLQCS